MPASNLTCTTSLGVGGTGTLIYGAFGACTWQGCVVIVGSGQFRVSISCKPTCVYWLAEPMTAGCAGVLGAPVHGIDIPSGCSGLFGGVGVIPWILRSHTCSPLNIVWQENFPFVTWAFTP